MPVDPPTLSSVLLPFEHQSVQSFLTNARQKDVEKSTTGDWEQKTSDFCRNKGVTQSTLDEDMPRKLRLSPFLAHVPKREQMIIKAYSVLEPKMTSIECKHQIERCTACTGDTASAVIPGSKMWLMNAPRHPRFLLGAEGLIVHGVGLDIVEAAHGRFPNNLMMDLAGNCFASTIPLAIELSIISNMTDKQIEAAKEPRLQTSAMATFLKRQAALLKKPAAAVQKKPAAAAPETNEMVAPADVGATDSQEAQHIAAMIC